MLAKLLSPQAGDGVSPVNVTLRPHDYALEFSVPAHNEVNNK